MIKECKIHGNVEHKKRTDRLNGYVCKKCNVERINKFREKNMQKALDSKGHKCKNCGYNKCDAALEFHHINPKEKSFMINKSNTISWKRIEKELKKCILLCANCHRELHNGM